VQHNRIYVTRAAMTKNISTVLVAISSRSIAANRSPMVVPAIVVRAHEKATRHLEQTAAMVPPSVIYEFAMDRTFRLAHPAS
jgi:hypothetical protein